jgi:hypothetical protein
MILQHVCKQDETPKIGFLTDLYYSGLIITFGSNFGSMINYIRRSVKFILYIAIVFALVLTLLPLITKEKPVFDSFSGLLRNDRFRVLIFLLFGYSIVYPMIAFTSIQRHLNGSFADNRHIFENVFRSMNYALVEETPERIVYRKKSALARFAQWWEDKIVIHIAETPVKLSGLRKALMRINRLIDQELMKAGG